jgi:hypothetical protein
MHDDCAKLAEAVQRKDPKDSEKWLIHRQPDQPDSIPRIKVPRYHGIDTGNLRKPRYPIEEHEITVADLPQSPPQKKGMPRYGK